MDSYQIQLFNHIVYIHPPSVWGIVSIVLASVLLLASGFVSASEVSCFSLKPTDKNEIESGQHKRDKLLLRLLEQSQHLLATILILNNLINVSIIILCNIFFNSVFDFTQAPLVGFFIQTILLTFLLLFFGEVMPKIYATHRSLQFSRVAAPVLSIFGYLFKPLADLLIWSTRYFKSLVVNKGENISLDDLSKALELTSNDSDEDKQMLEGIIRFGDKTAKEIMTSRLDITSLDRGASFREVQAEIVECGYSRIPVCEGTQDSIKGILYIKDLLPHINKPDSFRWQTLIRPAFFVPELKKVDGLLEEFQKNKIHIAIVVDEYGGTSGLVTLEDILEEIVGEINDEYDDDEQLFTRLKDGSYLFDGKTTIDDFCRALDLDENTFEEVWGEADTLAGLILEMKGEFPIAKEVISYKEHDFQVIDIDRRRIKKLKYTQLSPENETHR